MFDPRKQKIEVPTETERFSNVSYFVDDLVQSDKISAMQRLVDEARESGISTESMADIRRRAIEQVDR